MLRNIILIVVLAYSVATSLLLYALYSNQTSCLSVKHTSVPQATTFATPLDPKKNIILNAIPKSGSAYIAQALEDALHYQHVTISNEYIPYDQINYKKAQAFFSSGGKLSKQHMEPSGINLQILQRFTDRMVLNVRDPREVLLSWTHYLRSEHAKKADLYYVDPEPPQSYYQLSFEEQVNWNIQNFLPGMVQWLQAWLDYKKTQDLTADGFKILIVKYEDLVYDEFSLYRKILKFYDIPESDFKLQAPVKSSHLHFRKGEIGEWRRVLTTSQQAEIAKIVPRSLLDEFGWS